MTEKHLPATDIEGIENEISAMLKPAFQPASITSQRPRIALASETTISTEARQDPPMPIQDPPAPLLPNEPRTVTEWLHRLDARLTEIYDRLAAIEERAHARLGAIEDNVVARLGASEATTQAKLDEVLGVLK
jgi:hypothetical protein